MAHDERPHEQGDVAGLGPANGSDNGLDGKRFRMSPPERDAPLRHAGEFLQTDRAFSELHDKPAHDTDTRGHDHSHTDPNHTDQTHRKDAHHSGVDEGVMLGYRVIDEYLHQARKLARKIAPHKTGLGRTDGLSGDLGHLADESIAFYKHSVDLWLRLAKSMSQQVVGGDTPMLGELLDLARKLAGAGESRHGSDNDNDSDTDHRKRKDEPEPGGWTDEPVFQDRPAAAAQEVTLSIQSMRPVRVTHELKPGCDLERLVIYPLRCVDGSSEISSVGFESDDGALCLHLRVDADVAPGTYHGLVVDGGNRAAAGSVTVVVAA